MSPRSSTFPSLPSLVVMEVKVSLLASLLLSSAAHVQVPRGGPRSRLTIGALATQPPRPPWQQHLPNTLSLGRIAALPLLAASFYSAAAAERRVPAAVFLGIAITDWLDGFLARRWGVQSEFGAFVDPVADKLLVCVCFVLLSGAMGGLVAVPTSIIVSREIAISALREWMAARGKSDLVAVGWWGKLKTASQMLALFLLLSARPGISRASPLDAACRWYGLLSLSVATALTIGSGCAYFREVLRPSH
ncbi:hypothetical protein AB1Y20_021526 [Prymnesium parvum]|uniref:CDP-diacylglycerol--glycerol-3-phosphate 3-phosphatidyltransferase n=1 Tax=Prymnesium parvum TaxID=97485 RepID=A0AB34JLS4_PRYPA